MGRKPSSLQEGGKGLRVSSAALCVLQFRELCGPLDPELGRVLRPKSIRWGPSTISIQCTPVTAACDVAPLVLCGSLLLQGSVWAQQDSQWHSLHRPGRGWAVGSWLLL